MFDAKKLLDALLAVSASPAQPGAAPADTADLVGGVLAKIKAAAGQARQKTEAAGGVGGAAKQVLGQATSGVKAGARDFEAATGAGARLDEVVRQLSGGKSAGDLLAQVKDLAADNPGAAGAIAAGLGALMLGTKSGRGLAVDAAKLGGLVLIGGLAYKAYRNHEAGKPMLDIGAPPPAPPSGTGFEAAAQSGADALLYVRAMIAAAAADGEIDQGERARIIGGMRQAGLDAEAAAFLQREFASPASTDALVAAATTPETRTQVYAAARLAIEPDTVSEREFLFELGRRLGLDQPLIDNIDQAASGLKA